MRKVRDHDHPRQSPNTEAAMHLNQIPAAEEREKIEGELMKIDIALSFFEKELSSRPTVSK
jgi:hypothetical protein